MFVVREGFLDAEPAHDGERNMIDDSGLGRLATFVGRPSRNPVVLAWYDQLMAKFESISQFANFVPKATAGCGVAAFQQNKRGRDHGLALSGQASIGRRCQAVPLVAFVPLRDQSDRVEKYDTHG